MQKTLRLKAYDGKIILIEVNSQKKNTSAVLVVHGYSGNAFEHFHHNAANLFPKRGIDTWRIQLYPGDEGTRGMPSTTGNDHLKDIKSALAVMSKEYKRVFIIGHSYGGALAVHSVDKRITAAVLWDPSYNRPPLGKSDEASHDAKKGFFHLHWGISLLVSEKFDKDFSTLTHFDHLLPGYRTPTLALISSERDIDYSTLRAHPSFTFATIPNSDHCFNRECNEKELFSKTLRFLKRFV